jgi:hypothetical protein
MQLSLKCGVSHEICRGLNLVRLKSNSCIFSITCLQVVTHTDFERVGLSRDLTLVITLTGLTLQQMYLNHAFRQCRRQSTPRANSGGTETAVLTSQRAF